jgi:hypothetical protein
MNACRLLMGKPEGTRPLRRLRCTWVGNIKKDLGRDRMGWYELDWSGLGQEEVTGSCEYGNKI